MDTTGGGVARDAAEVADDARDAAEELSQRVRRARWYRILVGAGLCAYGVVHLIIAGIALRLAWSGDGQASEQGALRTLAGTPAGPLLLIMVGIGLAVLVPWQALEAALGHGKVAVEHDPKRRTLKRLSSASRALVYLLLAASAFRFVGGAGSGSSEDSITAKLMTLPLGRILVAAVGIGVIAVGVSQVIKGSRRSFTADLVGSTSAAGRAVGVAGYITKGIALALVGGLFGWAALTFDPRRAGGLDEALRLVRNQPAGPVLLTVLAGGLACFGLFCFVWAKNAKT
ncbi:DUF1206 domain-containing protein [Microlunatus soli]|uniref:DUF1206 domain-containing protein n=1 Tax=Microlunatus soli TaxID=630515 RepID=A0A1H1NDQ1_9ACTN|nr:DUF1206 domain-containing protein [Microlunatus soli]SDR97096.1 protein of unknown function [Microlunatus soli]